MEFSSTSLLLKSIIALHMRTNIVNLLKQILIIFIKTRQKNSKFSVYLLIFIEKNPNKSK